MRGLLIILFLLPSALFSQRMDPYAVGDVTASKNDTPPQKQGVIKVRKAAIRPYFKCEYYLTLARVTEVPVEVPSPSGFGVENKMVPVFDSAVYSKNYVRRFPTKLTNFSRMLDEQIKFVYTFSDTSNIDTMAVDMWIAKNGKIRWREIDTSYTSGMPRALQMELYMVVNNMTEWGSGGGYSTPKKFLRKQKAVAESYYCRLYIIVSAKPITAQQRSTNAHFTTMDTPLNSPDGGIREENTPKLDSGTRNLNDSIIWDEGRDRRKKH